VRLGAIDVGTNSIHAIVVELDPRFGTSRTILKSREMVRLGSQDALARGYLPRKSVQRGVEAISRFAGEARRAGASEIRAVATSAVREAENRNEFLAAVKAATGVDVEVLSEEEEARLIHLGVSRGYPLYDRMACIVDIGGGSTEFIVADAERTYFVRSVRLGSLRLYDEYLRDAGNAVDAGVAQRKLVRHIKAVLGPLAAKLAGYRFESVIGTSGTLLGLAALDAAAAGLPAQRMHGYVLHLSRLRALEREMLAMTPAERRKMPGMNPRRSDIIVAGAAVAIAALELLERGSFVVCERALREGIVVDYLERNVELVRRLGDERMRRFDAAHELAKRFGSDAVHENHVAALALMLFDAFGDLHGFEPADRDLLFAAALVHDVGRAINVSAHHKHGAYVVRNSGLAGWRDDDLSLIATLVRYHRKTMPKTMHPEWASADASLRRRIAGLAALLRIADGLDARHLGVVTHVEVTRADGAYRLAAHAQQDVAPEIAAARFKADLFERAFETQLEIVARRDVYAGSEPGEESAAEIAAPSMSG
jgi:exopolyphosphatase/guanosine-5'-triphosphate,3'-diphosphate pyrophosphatase